MSEENKPKVTIYTDGGADPNPGPGGWGVVLIHETTGTIKEISGGEQETTNNRMELTAAIAALTALKKPCDVHIYTDSEYLRRGITEWIEGWKRKSWKKVQNVELWQALDALVGTHEIKWEWVKGHAGNTYNERADQLATEQIRLHYEGQAGANPVDAQIFVRIAFDGGYGGWAALVKMGSTENILAEGVREKSANRVDLVAVHKALSSLPDDIRVRVYTPNSYVRNGAADWIAKWKKNNWRTKEGEEVKNADLWSKLDEEMHKRDVEWPPIKEDPAEFAELDKIADQMKQQAK